MTKINILDTERLKMNGEELVYFMDHNALGNKLIETIEEVGAQKFFSSPDRSMQKARERVAEYFFVLGLKKDSGQDWFLMQPKEDPPDFALMTVADNPIMITLDDFELVEIPSRCKSFEEMLGIVHGKLNKGYAQKYNLLIFVNHERSKEWINELHKKIQDFSSFKTVWTVHLVWHKEKSDLYESVVNRLRPYPARTIEVALSDPVLRQNSPLSDYTEEAKIDGKTFISLRQDFVKKLTTAMRKSLLARSQAKRK